MIKNFYIKTKKLVQVIIRNTKVKYLLTYSHSKTDVIFYVQARM